MQAIYLDVSELSAPEPMRQIFLALAALSLGQCLVIYHRKNPVPLYPKLTELGFVYRVDVEHSLSDSTALRDSQSNKHARSKGRCEDLAVVIKVAFKTDESALASFSEMELQ
ncbi:DUF2249 domain-containing protein [Moritella yayanosii]|uniref:DUF2249 domain-containing protein n=1 Tax=Moritella yayanosii TaxID=69539 RepID=UPI001E567FB0|nr:DUF2249 domain-containing protein [Moritella yayanosii]